MTDNIHQFEQAGLGIAPFRFVRVEYRRYQAHPSAPVQPGAACDYCGTGIVETCIIRDARGKEFKVGNDCVKKTGDVGIISPMRIELNRLRRLAQHVKDDARIANAKEILESASVRTILNAQPHPYTARAERGETRLNYLTFLLQNAGRKGGIEAARELEKLVGVEVDANEVARFEAEQAARLAAERDAAIEAERVERARKQAAIDANADIIDALQSVPYVSGFISDMVETLHEAPLPELKLSVRQRAILADIYAKQVGGRRGSKAYEAAYERVNPAE